MKNYMLKESTKKKISLAHKTSFFAIEARKKLHASQVGKPKSLEVRLKISQSLKGNIPWNKGRKVTEEERKHLSTLMKGKKHSVETKRKMSLAHKGKQYTLGYSPTIETRKKLSEAHKGKKHYNWKGGITSKNMVIRRSLDIRLWREKVFKRDKYTCRKCRKKGGFLNAHHIKAFSKYPDLRFNVKNGLTVCMPCHKKLHEKRS